MSTLAKIRPIGNSKGILLPKSFLEECGIKTDVTISIKEKAIVISATDKKEKKRWLDIKKSKQKVSSINNTFDEKDWTW